MNLREALEGAITLLHLNGDKDAEEVLYSHYRELFPDSTWKYE